MAFGLWDTDAILDGIPPRILNQWRARYLIEPWDAATTQSVVEIRYKQPGWVKDTMETASREQKRKAGRRFLTAKEIRRRFKEAGW